MALQLLRFVPCIVLFLFSSAVRAEPPRPASSLLEDGDLDLEDFQARTPLLGKGIPDTFRASARLSLVGFRALSTHADQGGLMLVLSIPFDRIENRRSIRLLSDAPANPSRPVLPLRGHDMSWSFSSRILVTPDLARRTIHESLRVAGIPEGDDFVEHLASRARRSALLPETRFRFSRGTDERMSADLASVDLRSSGASQLSWFFETRLTWRLDRALFADEEPTLVRIAQELREAKQKVVARVMDILFAWQRARYDTELHMEGSREHLESTMRVAEHEVTLDVLTGGWFASRNRVSKPAGPWR